MLRFRKEDAGLLFAATLVGAGVGLLIGSYLSYRYAFAGDEVDDVELDTAVVKPVVVTNIVNYANPLTKKGAIPPVPSKPLTVEDKMLEGLSATYDVTPMQSQMFRAGLISFKDLMFEVDPDVDADVLGARLGEGGPNNYNAPFVYHEDKDKPELGDLIDISDVDDEIIDGRFVISYGMPDGKKMRDQRQIVCDQAGKRELTHAKNGRQITIGDVTKWVSRDALNRALEFIEETGVDSVYINDLNHNTNFYLVSNLEDPEGPGSDDNTDFET